MKAEFNSRVDLQREVIKIVNENNFKNKLNGLSMPAIESWILNNNISNDVLKKCLVTISEKLFFIANKSQDQITEEYKNLQISVRKNILELKNVFSV
ncbi:hypothetical protein FLACOL_02319 [Flavobacterium columnare]|uniref:Mobilization protein n=2 Tax=Flavobacterium TaxID=237 RepID=A0ABW8PUT3_9FLAO|nr:hypothetical protein [Flavobacterium columnare]SPE78303.1 hypothetical protein FLACOL_02319 [Flavobacterium columnare]